MLLLVCFLLLVTSSLIKAFTFDSMYDTYQYSGIIINWITLYNSLSPDCQNAFSSDPDNPVANYTDMGTSHFIFNLLFQFSS